VYHPLWSDYYKENEGIYANANVCLQEGGFFECDLGASS
jgi:hypothetical protein